MGCAEKISALIICGIIFEYYQVIIKIKYNTMSKGTVKFFNDAKGFGFITEEGVDKDHFVHISGLIDEIREGDQVEFDLEEGKKGLNAVNVKVI
jgi:CspA family cold shock protein